MSDFYLFCFLIGVLVVAWLLGRTSRVNVVNVDKSEILKKGAYKFAIPATVEVVIATFEMNDGCSKVKTFRIDPVYDSFADSEDGVRRASWPEWEIERFLRIWREIGVAIFDDNSGCKMGDLKSMKYEVSYEPCSVFVWRKDHRGCSHGSTTPITGGDGFMRCLRCGSVKNKVGWRAPIATVSVDEG